MVIRHTCLDQELEEDEISLMTQACFDQILESTQIKTSDQDKFEIFNK